MVAYCGDNVVLLPWGQWVFLSDMEETIPTFLLFIFSVLYYYYRDYVTTCAIIGCTTAKTNLQQPRWMQTNANN